MIEAANKLGFLLLSLSYGGNIIIDPSSIETVSDYTETAGKKSKTFRSISTGQNPKGWLVIETIEEILQQLETIENEQEPV